MTKLQELKQRHDELKAQIKTESEAWFKEASRGLFDKYPAMESFSWRQYTPYFNDGDECIFSVNSDPDINGQDEYSDNPPVPKEVYREVMALIDSIDSPTMKEMFGDHCEVIAKRDGVTVEEYEHD